MREREEPKVTSGFLALATVGVSPLREREDGRKSRFGKEKGKFNPRWRFLGAAWVYSSMHEEV